MPKQKFQWERGDDDEEQHFAVGEREGRGGVQRKKEAEAIYNLGRQLVDMPAHEWAHLSLSERLIESLAKAQELEGRARHRNAYRRQLLAVAGVLRTEEHAAIAEALDGTERGTAKDRALVEVEYWRTRILESGDDAIDALLADHPGGDRQRLRQLARQARKDRAKAKEGEPVPGRAFKGLFAALREAMGV
ncbi:MAG: DUF615 domain-containing protein [Deltaproteobacteria bacterium]|nr:DUF615 domain-containing protein [Deltaproteobacteria bacterium]